MSIGLNCLRRTAFPRHLNGISSVGVAIVFFGVRWTINTGHDVPRYRVRQHILDTARDAGDYIVSMH